MAPIPGRKVGGVGGNVPRGAKVLTGIGKTLHARRSVLANTNQVDVLQRVRKILNKSDEQKDEEDNSTKSRLKVAIRLRPLSIAEQNSNNVRDIINVLGPKLLIFDPPQDSQEFFYHNKKQKDVTAKKFKNLKFAFDYVYDDSASTGEIYNEILYPLVETLFTGINCSVFAYGATGSGKTFTMMGENIRESRNNQSTRNFGLMYYAIDAIFKKFLAMNDDFESELVASFFEVYNEQVKDLLVANGESLPIREVGNGIEITNLSYHRASTCLELEKMVDEGNRRRSQHPTEHNAQSSRSHAVLQLHIQVRQRHSSLTNSSINAKLVMVDLAGSEKGSATGYTGNRFREGTNINRSLLALGNCISALASGKKFIQFRDSKLTRILKDSLGGNCKTVMIANISPSSVMSEDTLNTLRYADKAKKISRSIKKNVMTVQACLSQYTRVVDEMASKIETLEAQVKEKDELLQEYSSHVIELRQVLDRKSESVEQMKHLLKVQQNVSGNNTEVLRMNQGASILSDTLRSQSNEAVKEVAEIFGKDATSKARLQNRFEKYGDQFFISNKRFDRYKSLYMSTGDSRYERAAKGAQKKMKTLIKKLDSLLSSTTMQLVNSAQNGSLYYSHQDLWDEKNPKENSTNAYELTREEMYDHLVQNVRVKDLSAENEALKSTLTVMSKQLEEKDQQLVEAIGLTNKQQNILKNYGHDPTSLNDQCDSLVLKFCGQQVHFADSYCDKEESRMLSQGTDDSISINAQSSETGNDTTECKNLLQFCNTVLHRVVETWKTSDTDSSNEIEALVNSHQNQIKELMPKSEILNTTWSAPCFVPPAPSLMQIDEVLDLDYT